MKQKNANSAIKVNCGVALGNAGNGVKDSARNKYEAWVEDLATLFGLEGERRTTENIVACAKEALRQLRRDR